MFIHSLGLVLEQERIVYVPHLGHVDTRQCGLICASNWHILKAELTELSYVN